VVLANVRAPHVAAQHIEALVLRTPGQVKTLAYLVTEVLLP
jgi:hypothetical protein